MNMRQFSSMHTHTLFCDGKDDPETMCRAAYEKNLCAIGFSAHAPVSGQTGIKTNWHVNEERLGEYAQEVLAAKRRWQGKLAVYFGFEVDYIRGLRSPLDSDIKALSPDFLIGSVHYIVPANGAAPFTVDGPPEEFEKGLAEGFGGNGEALMHSYWDAVAEMTATGGFDILGHIDIIKKNCQDKKYWPYESEMIRHAEIARAAAGFVTEVNTGGLNRKKITDTYPSLPFLRLLREQGGRVIITADAHNAADIDGNYDAALRNIVDAGFSDHVLFDGRINGKANWKSVPIFLP
ncbi:MAG: histidinol-phosphatase [Treponema sp.]|jgi:histidinol-phosphatase (PHP family)|nr:histidinol-phosphatase [Treponema sp.]